MLFIEKEKKLSSKNSKIMWTHHGLVMMLIKTHMENSICSEYIKLVYYSYNITIVITVLLFSSPNQHFHLNF